MIRTGLLAVIATLPLIPDKLFFMKLIEEAFKSLTATGIGFLITAAILLLTIRLKGGEKGPAETSWLDALLVGIAQMFAPLPGVSRSGLTISAALALGFSRTWAVNFSLMMAVPAILGATVFELRKLDPHTLTGDRVAQIVASAALAGVIGYLAIVWLLRLVRSGRLWYFSVYLVVLGLGLIAVDQLKGGRRDARPTQALDRPVRGVAPGPGDRAGLAASRRASGWSRRRLAREQVTRLLAAAVEGGRTAPGLVLGRRLEGDGPRPALTRPPGSPRRGQMAVLAEAIERADARASLDVLRPRSDWPGYRRQLSTGSPPGPATSGPSTARRRTIRPSRPRNGRSSATTGRSSDSSAPRTPKAGPSGRPGCS